MRLHGVFPNTEKLVRAWIAAWLVERGFLYDVWTELPDGWEDDDVANPVPLVLVERITSSGNSDDSPTFYDGRSYIDVTVFTRTRAELWPIVQTLEVCMLALPNSTTPSIDSIGNPQVFGEVPYDNPALRRAIATYDLTARAQQPGSASAAPSPVVSPETAATPGGN
jgi:hypothetical protein